MYKLTEHKDEIVTNIIANIVICIITYLFGHIILWIPFIVGVYSSFKSNTYIIPIYAFVLAGISVIVMFFVTIISVMLAIKQYKKKAEITTDLIFDEFDIELYFKDRQNIFTYLTYNCIVNKDNYNEKFIKSIIWTGDKYNYTKIVESNGSYTLTDSTRSSSPYTYTIDFNKTFSLGDSIYFKLETCVNDDNLSMAPVFSHMIKHQTNKFNIRVTVSSELISNVRASVYKDIVRTISVPTNIDIERKTVGNLIQFSYSINEPKLLNNYCIEWDFK